MANTSRSRIVRGYLENASIQYRNMNWIGDRTFTIMDGVPQQTQLTVYEKGAYFRREAQQGTGGSEAPRSKPGTTTIPITPKKYWWAQEITQDERDVFASMPVGQKPKVNLDQDAVEYCANMIDLEKEIRIANTILNGTWSGVSTGEDATGGWAQDASTNTFITDVETRIETIRANTGQRPNKLMITANVLPHIKQISAVLDRIRYTERGIVTADLIASLFGLEEVLIGDAIYSTAKEKKDGTDFTAANVWEKNPGKGSAFLFYAPESIGLKAKSAGVQARMSFQNGSVRQVRTWNEPSPNQDVYEVSESTDIVVTGSYLGFLWRDVIAT